MLTYPISSAAEYQVNINIITISEKSIEKRLISITKSNVFHVIKHTYFIVTMTDFIHFTTVRGSGTWIMTEQLTYKSEFGVRI